MRLQAGLLHALAPDLHITSKELGQLFGLTSFALSLLLVFRTNASYEVSRSIFAFVSPVNFLMKVYFFHQRDVRFSMSGGLVCECPSQGAHWHHIGSPHAFLVPMHVGIAPHCRCSCLMRACNRAPMAQPFLLAGTPP